MSCKGFGKGIVCLGKIAAHKLSYISVVILCLFSSSLFEYFFFLSFSFFLVFPSQCLLSKNKLSAMTIKVMQILKLY